MHCAIYDSRPEFSIYVCDQSAACSCSRHLHEIDDLQTIADEMRPHVAVSCFFNSFKASMSLIWINPKHILQHAVEKSGVLAGDVKENKPIPWRTVYYTPSSNVISACACCPISVNDNVCFRYLPGHSIENAELPAWVD
jgi:hypothetical protein